MAHGGQGEEEIQDVSGLVVDYRPQKWAYRLSLHYHGDYIGDAYYDGNKLRRTFKGIGDVSDILDQGDEVFVTVERAQKKRYAGMRVDWVVTKIRPRLDNVKLNYLPEDFVEYLEGRRNPIAEIGYCQQVPPHNTGVPCNRAAEFIGLVRNELAKWNGIAVAVLLEMFRNRNKQPYSDFVAYLSSETALKQFLGSYPQYFVVKQRGIFGTDTAVFLTRRFGHRDFETFLKVNGEGDGPPHEEQTFEVIDTLNACRRACDRLIRRADRRRTPLVLALDCEGNCLGKEGDLYLLQLSTPEGEAFIFDVTGTHRTDDMFVRGRLGLVLEHENIVKVLHNCRSDQAALFWQFGISLNNVFDTSIAYATISVQCNTTIEYVQPSLAKICQVYKYPLRMKGGYIADKMKYDHDFWARRPLTSDMIEYAIDDVLSLVPLIYDELNRLISPLWRPLFNKRCEERLEGARS